ncbi:galactose mutarotase-like protein [Patellaria atrata CBS 101060]|uniref:Glucose-6-phosphate 1-epimerase n=1 Tax=Patellaria atrata CBS 101060 TaxID=1346257 RepID=A0A9P4VN70_9PEZI|nr:galactose mutarotase-like protein [Patellaria atrata CBS 101060]
MVERSHKPGPISATTASSLPQAQVNVSDDNSKVTATIPSGDTVEVLLYGATIISWKSNGTENFWVSDAAKLDGSKPVRGGVPVVFPVFGPPPKNHATSSLPQHGFARNSRWEYLGKSTSESASDDSVKMDFGLYSAGLSEEAKKAWPYDFGLVYSVTLTKGELSTILTVRNEGKEGFDFNVLLHTYLRIKDISTTTISGLLGTSYVDKVLDARESTESNSDLRITGETDRVYKSLAQDTTTVVENGSPRFDVVRKNFRDTVIWNPWTEKAKGMGDFEPKTGWREMLCVEVGSVAEWVRVEEGESWEAGQTIKSLV